MGGFNVETVEYVWYSRKQHGERFGERCTIVGWTDRWGVLRVRFHDGVVVECLRTSIRRAAGGG